MAIDQCTLGYPIDSNMVIEIKQNIKLHSIQTTSFSINYSIFKTARVNCKTLWPEVYIEKESREFNTLASVLVLALVIITDQSI